MKRYAENQCFAEIILALECGVGGMAVMGVGGCETEADRAGLLTEAGNGGANRLRIWRVGLLF